MTSGAAMQYTREPISSLCVRHMLVYMRPSIMLRRHR
ncbi:hypothetical protein E5Q_04763 [Mixia osmundae IAM 14324]|uniref:Uncharacterized protein n=1 Tax=Mixia osmundae (strain CBS 9802 / IAM 14324 / JCM 22182 / KY 12970) TaxID=764103 RepID=G7E5H1_MIXOS|nr:hypothetical protein E5Q_04763 [Mixia osmundae IAM 14324]